MAKPGRFEMKIDPKTKRLAEKNLEKVGFPDLSAFARRAFDLLASGEASQIGALCINREPYIRVHERTDL